MNKLSHKTIDAQDLIYDNLNEVYRDPTTWKRVDTETWLKRRQWTGRLKNIIIGTLVSIGLFLCSLAILCGLLR